MKKVWIGMLGLVGAGALLLATTSTPDAADHNDSPAQDVSKADIYDLYAWMTDDNLNLVMTLEAGGLSDTVQYAFHINSSADGMAAGQDIDIICTIASATDKTLTCWVGDDEAASGDASTELAGTVGGDFEGKFKAHVNDRNDPFFANLVGFTEVVTAVQGVGPTLDGTCPALDGATAETLVDQLAQDADGNAGVDSLAGANVTALVIQIDKGLVNSGGAILKVWGSTHQAP